MAVAIIVLGKEVMHLLSYTRNASIKCNLSNAQRNFQNSPKYLACLHNDQELQFRYKMHTALDFIEEKLSSTTAKSSNDVRELYLGQLYAAEDYKLYPILN